MIKIHIDGIPVELKPGLTLQDLIRNAGLESLSLEQRPLAAKIAGEVFNLNYIPVRSEEEKLHNSCRHAMAVSNGNIQLIRYKDPMGRDVYSRTAQFMLFVAIRQLWPDARAKMNCTVGRALFVEIRNASDFSVDKLKIQFSKLVQEDLPLLRRRVAVSQAQERFAALGMEDKSRLLSWQTEEYFDEYFLGNFSDCYYGELAPSTGYLQVWDILPVKGGIMLVYPDDNTPDKLAKYQSMPNFLQVCTEGERWCELMGCETVADLNDMVKSGKIRELIRVNEALHEKRFSQVADSVISRGAKAVMLAGPSSSGKTTSANRLATQLRAQGKKPVLISLDDYYFDRDLIPIGADGKKDFEHINAIDTELFRQHLEQLFLEQPVQLPSFDFLSGKRVWKGHELQMHEDSVLIVEGLHALNPVLLPKTMAQNLVFKLYVSPLLPLNLDDHNRIPTSLLRLLRRTVRDYENRGSSVQQTMAMWDSVRRGEKLWIFPFQENADLIFNSSTLYELAVLKKHIYPLLMSVKPEEECYEVVRELVTILGYIQEADVDDEIPPTSLVREFIGGNTFYR